MLYSFDNKSPLVGKETYVSDSAKVIGNVYIGDNCYIGHGVIVRGDYGRIEIGNGTAIEEGVIIHAPPHESSQIGDMVTIGHGAIVHSKYIGAKAVIGMGAVLSIRSIINEYSIIAEGSIVKMNQEIPAGMVAAGNPARIVRKTSPKDEKLWNYGKQLYIDLAKKYIEQGMIPL